jgi:predicted homoserine dehydrogenase-like protein
MIIVDRALEELARADSPIRVGLIGAGFMGRGIALQILTSVPGMELVAIANRNIDGAKRAYSEAGIRRLRYATSVKDLENAISQREHVITDDALLLCQAEGIQAIIEVTGTVEFGAAVALEAFRYGKHLILMNAELDGTLGPILKHYAERAGVIFTACDGDQPGVQMNLFRFVKGIGMKPLLCGNIKGLHDPYRTPITQADFARRWGQKPHMVTGFADGTKISFEQAIVANATGMRVAQRGMLGHDWTGRHVDELTQFFDVDQLEQWGGIVDYVVGALPAPGVFVLATNDDARQRHYLNLYKLGEGPLYCFYTPYHLCHFEVPNSVARAVLFRDAAMVPLGAPCVDVVATAKRDLRKGEAIDGIGYFMTFGQCENSDSVREQGLLPMGLAEGCRLKRDVCRDQVLTYADVELPRERLSDTLREQQDALFSGHTARSPVLSHVPATRSYQYMVDSKRALS